MNKMWKFNKYNVVTSPFEHNPSSHATISHYFGVLPRPPLGEVVFEQPQKLITNVTALQCQTPPAPPYCLIEQKTWLLNYTYYYFSLIILTYQLRLETIYSAQQTKR